MHIYKSNKMVHNSLVEKSHKTYNTVEHVEVVMLRTDNTERQHQGDAYPVRCIGFIFTVLLKRQYQLNTATNLAFERKTRNKDL